MAEPLKNSFGPDVPERIGDKIASVYGDFDRDGFLAAALDGYSSLELTPRARHISTALARTLPSDRQRAIEILIDSLGPEIDSAELTGMESFRYLPLVFFVAEYGLIQTTAGFCVEEYDSDGRFVRLCYCPQDEYFDPTWQRDQTEDGSSRIFRDGDSCVVRHETYEPTGEFCGDVPLLLARIYNADGRLIMVHEKRVVSDTAYDIHVKDAAGKLKGVIHHSDVDRGEPFTISEEWPE